MNIKQYLADIQLQSSNTDSGNLTPETSQNPPNNQDIVSEIVIIFIVYYFTF